MQNEGEGSSTNACGRTVGTSRRSISLFLLVVGGFLLLEGIAAIMHLAGVLTKTDVGYAEAGFLAFVGAIIVWYAVTP